MSEAAQPRAYGPTPGWFFAETAIYFVVILALFWLLDLGTAALTLLVGLAGGLAVLVVLQLMARPKPDRESRFPRFLAGIYILAGGLLGFLAIIVANIAWMNFGLDLDRVSSVSSYDIVGEINRDAVRVIAVVVSLALLCYFLSLAGFRRRGVVSGSIMSLVRAELAGFLRSPMIEGAATVLAVVGLLSWTASLFALQELVASMFFERQTGLIDVMTLFPILPIGLLATCMLITIARPPVGNNPGQIDEIRDHFRRTAAGGRRPPVWREVATAIASAVMMIAFVYPLHFGMVAAIGVVTGVVPWNTISTGVDDWIAAESEKGRGSLELVADLNRHSRWPADTPGEGLVVLIPGLEEELAESGSNGCVAEIAAAPFDPASLDGVDWVDEDWPDSDVRYCLRLSCPSPAAWDAPPPVILHSSHPSRNYLWTRNLYMDVMAYGAAPEPGGFCTAEGRLAEDFQG